MKLLSPRKLIGTALASLIIVNASAQVITIDLSDLSAATFTATGANSAINYSNGRTFEDGIALLSFFTSEVTQDENMGSFSSNSFGPSLDSPSIFGRLDTWDDSDPFSGSDSVGADITFWNEDEPYVNDEFTFSTSSAAFQGSVTIDFSGYANTNLFPSNGASGDVVLELG